MRLVNDPRLINITAAPSPANTAAQACGRTPIIRSPVRRRSEATGVRGLSSLHPVASVATPIYLTRHATHLPQHIPVTLPLGRWRLGVTMRKSLPHRFFTAGRSLQLQAPPHDSLVEFNFFSKPLQTSPLVFGLLLRWIRPNLRCLHYQL